MQTTRRQFLTQTAAAVTGATLVSSTALAAENTPAKLRLSACDWSLQAGGPEGLAIAKRVGLDGLEVSAGGPGDAIALADPALRQQYKDQAAETGVAISSLAMGFLNNAPLAEDARGPAWLEQTIDAAEDLDVKVLLLAFFGKGDLRKKRKLKESAVDVVVERLKEAAPRAEKAGVILGLENTLSGEQNLAILDRVQSDAVRVYYDIGNSTYNRYDVPAEIRALGDRICQIHIKDGRHFLGEGRVDMQAVADAIAEAGYEGWLVLETSLPTKDRDADFMKNAAFLRNLLGLA
ncbi:MAG: TIM barrel protein [Nitrospiraceae bacterium]|nr:TIM barrel protein [Nitrospiraceae bacterium]